MAKVKASDKPPAPEPSDDIAKAVARVRRLMIISGLTTLIAIAAVVGVIGYRIYGGGGSGAGAGAITNGTIFIPPGAQVVSTTVSGNQIVVTLEAGGVSEVRIFDGKTLRQTGQLHFATEK